VYLVLNNTADSNDLILTTGSGTTFTVPSGRDAFIYSDGTNVINALADLQVTTVNGIDVTNVTTAFNCHGFAMMQWRCC
jgi:hypothetical protein